MSVTRFFAALTALAIAYPLAARAQAVQILPPEQQIAAAIIPLPADLRAGATVLGYAPDGRLTTLRAGKGEMTCLASDPKLQRFHVACYHNALEPFMARGRALRASGVTGAEVDSVRFREAKAGALTLPKQPAVLYSATGAKGSFDPVTGTATGAQRLFVVYMPYATAASTGLSPNPARDAPWIMFPGTPKAHIMFTPSM
jgi:hypothetical protein